jgi:predicted dehydrogenase
MAPGVGIGANLRWGFIGSGQIAHAMAADIALTGTGRLLAVTSRNPANAATLARTFSASPRASIGELLSDPNVDAVYVATPPSTHCDIAIAALQAGKHVLVEKPLATSVADAQRIAAAAATSGTFCMEAMWTRFLPTVEQLLRDVRAGNLGEVQGLIADFSYAVTPSASHHLFQPDGGGVLLDRAVYGIALAHALFGEPTSVTSHINRGGTGVDEDVALLLTHAGMGGLTVFTSLTASCRVTGTNEAHIRGTLATATLHEPFFGATRVTMTPANPQVLGSRTSPSLAQRLTDFPLLTKPAVQARLERAKGFAKATLRERSIGNVPTIGAGYAHQLKAVSAAVAAGLQEEPLWTLDDSIAVLRVIEKARHN